MRTGAVVVILLAALLTGFLFWFNANFEYRSETVNTGPRQEARNNPYLALERLFEKTGLTVNRKQNIFASNSLPSPPASLLLPGERYAMAPADAVDLLQWVRSGGHLIVKARRGSPRGTTEDDPLLTPLGIRAHHETNRPPSDENRLFSFPDTGPGGQSAQLKLDSPVWLELGQEFPINWTVQDAQGRIVALELRLDEGQLVVLNELSFLTNEGIGQHDHAYVALRIFNAVHGSAIWIAEMIRMPSLFQLLRRHAWAPFLVLMAFIIALLFYTGARFGPIKPPSLLHRRSLMEHIRASGRFVWRHQDTEVLVKSARQGVYSRLRRSQPFCLHLPQDELWGHLAEISEQSIDDVYFAFNSIGHSKEADFTRTMRILQTIGNSL